MKDLTSLVDEIIRGKGYVLIPDALDATQVNEARSLVLKLAEKEKQEGKLLIDGLRERLYGLVYYEFNSAIFRDVKRIRSEGWS